ncbi:TIGR00297 family protein [Mucilaginibacter puniceus]
MTIQDILIYLLLASGASFSFIKNKLTLPGTVTGIIVGLLIYEGTGLTGFTMLCLFFIAGSWATAWHKDKKNINEASQPRTAWQVLANGGVATVLATISFIKPGLSPLLLVMIAGSFASAMADTLSSELGMVYGKRSFNIITLKKDERGLDGVVSIEGTLIGLAAAFVTAIVFCLYTDWDKSLFIITAAGFMGNIVDSVLGAVLERKKLIGNNTVNFLNTLIGALVCYILA